MNTRLVVHHRGTGEDGGSVVAHGAGEKVAYKRNPDVLLFTLSSIGK